MHGSSRNNVFSKTLCLAPRDVYDVVKAVQAVA